ncbi:hypothetical protein B5X24_HaOG210048 [Helicoverpa armigera]|nr:hypothetical protein B5X24_HaOG210048 [Helicoverpa armigera]
MEDFDVFTNEINFTKPLFKNILNKYVNDVPSTPNGPNYQSGRKLMAEECLSDNDDAGCAFHLSEAASASLRTMAVYRDEQLKTAENKLHKITSYIKPIKDLVDSNPISRTDKKLIGILSEGTDDITNVLDSFAIEDEMPLYKRYLHFSKENNVDNFLKILKELPKEWTVVQLTVPYNPNENLKPLIEYRTEVDSIYLSMFTNDYLDDTPLGPVTVHIPANITKEGERPLFTELYSLLDENYKTIDNAQFLNNKRLVQNYWSRREDIDLRMKFHPPNTKTKNPAIQPHRKLPNGIRAFSQAAMQVKDNDEWAGLKKAKRHPVILIVDEMLDTFPWETLPILNQHPVSRMENIHFLYYLYKIHESKIVDGYFAAKCDVGRYVINPEKNLDRMENRMTSFVEYWCPEWKGHVGEPPSPADFIAHLSEADVFLYCGHGDGCQLAARGGGAGVEQARGSALCVLSGCGSVRLAAPAPRAPPAAAHHHLHIAACPMVVGMLWEVTDLEVDKVVSTLLSLYVPSEAPLPWQSVGKAKWSNKILDTTSEQKGQMIQERDILRAVCRARGSTNYAMIASSVVARGLPVRIRE